MNPCMHAAFYVVTNPAVFLFAPHVGQARPWPAGLYTTNGWEDQEQMDQPWGESNRYSLQHTEWKPEDELHIISHF